MNEYVQAPLISIGLLKSKEHKKKKKMISLFVPKEFGLFRTPQNIVNK